MKVDLKLKTITLLHRSPLPENTLNKIHPPVVTLVKCLVLDTHTEEFRKGTEISVLFRHSTISKSADIQLHEGIEVHVWRPWFELSPSNNPLPAESTVWLCSRFRVSRPAESDAL